MFLKNRCPIPLEEEEEGPFEVRVFLLDLGIVVSQGVTPSH